MAGAKRVYALTDEEPETDDGYVTLVNAEEDKNGALSEATVRTGIWAWKHFHKADNTTTNERLRGDVVFDDVDFEYDPGKPVLHNVDLLHTGAKNSLCRSYWSRKNNNNKPYQQIL